MIRDTPGTASPTDLADDVGVSGAGMTGRLDGLEKAGWVQRTASPDDRRRVVVEITRDGADVWRRAMALRGAQEEEMVAVLTAREQEQLNRLLKKLTLWTETQVTTFCVSTTSSATVDADRKRVWDALTDPDLLPRLTPYLRRIDAGPTTRVVRWTWHLVRIPLLGSMVSPSFTEVMTYDEPTRIDFVHDPARTDEKAGVEGRYDLTEVAGGTRPRDRARRSRSTCRSPGLAKPAVHAAMRAVVATMGARFSHNLVRHLRAG